MPRWARANNVHKHRLTEATPWSQLKGGEAGGFTETERSLKRGSAIGASSHIQQSSSRKRAYKKKTDDVNGFMEYLKQTEQSQSTGPKNEACMEDILATALKNDNRREVRRIKRQTAKKNNMVCFNCRKPGHGLADCPEADNDEELGRGICYRCGSTEHEIHKCRAKVDPALGEYPYAKCFICGQTGHVSRSCPDNPKGLYSAGGCCRLCGSVEHFQKNCPEHQTSANSITVSRLSNRMSADQEDILVSVKNVPTKKTKVVVF